MKYTVDQLIARAVDLGDAHAAGRVVDHLREQGWTYMRIFERVKALRPRVDAGAWDDLLAESEDLEARAP